MTRWEDLPWNERILGLDLGLEEKSAAIILIGDLGEPWPARQEAAVPKDRAVALDSIRKRLKAPGEGQGFGHSSPATCMNVCTAYILTTCRDGWRWWQGRR